MVPFVKASVKMSSVRSISLGLQAKTYNWSLKVNIEKHLKFSETATKPDIVLHWGTFKQVVLLEHSIPREGHIGNANEGKKRQYADLVGLCQNNVWEAKCDPSEVEWESLQASHLQSLHAEQ